ncbi:MAG: protein arginine kinase [Clostridia bacterium]|nr:protein arginine kinase [Clostridia bacterium]
MIWYKTKGKDCDVVISSRIRFARNIEGYPMGAKLTDEKAEEIITAVSGAMGEGYKTIAYSNLSPLEAQSYAEGHYVSPDFAAAKNKRALILGEADNISLMVLEEDHLRIQCIEPGFALEEAFTKAVAVDDRIDGAVKYAYDETLGYLTHCPTNLGTGMRASVMLFLPALTMNRQISRISAQMSKMGITIRGMYGEGSEAVGCLYQISNQITLGVSEEDIIKKITEIVRQTVELERSARNSIYSDNTDLLTDRILRSYGVMKYAHMITSEEFMKLWADVRLGVALGIISEEDMSYDQLGELSVAVMPATLSLTSGAQDERSRDIARAERARA